MGDCPLKELSSTSLDIRHQNRGLLKEKDRIVREELYSLTDTYRKELYRKNQELSAQKELFNNPLKLVERAKEIENIRLEQKYKGLLEDMEINILAEAQIRLESGQKVTTFEIDNWIREYAPKEELGVHNPWGALDIITNRERDAFETKLHNEIKAYAEKLERQREEVREEIKQEVKLEQEQERPRSRGRRM